MRNDSTVEGAEMSNKREPNVDKWCGEKPSSVSRCIVYKLRDKYEVPRLNKPMPWPYHRLYIDGFYKDDFLKVRSTQSKK